MEFKREIVSLLRAFRFPTYELSGQCKFGGGSLTILYAGSNTFRSYVESMAFDESASSTFLGKLSLANFICQARNRPVDLQIMRSHLLLEKSGLFRQQFFVPDWLSGNSNLEHQLEIEKTSKSRQRDRKIFARERISYTVSTDPVTLNYFYDEMYVPHVMTSHGDSALPMSRDKMFNWVNRGLGELVFVLRDEQPVAGSFVIYENGQPRLLSAGVLRRDKTLMRHGVGTALYLFSFDYLYSKGFRSVHMGHSRSFLSDGALYFKQRFGLQVRQVSNTGSYLSVTSNSLALRSFLINTGFIHYRRNSIRAATVSESHDPDSIKVIAQRRDLATNLGITNIDTIEIPDN